MELPTIYLPSFPGIHLSIIINTPVLIVIFILFLALYLVVTSVLMYHWSAYGMRSPGILVAETMFVFVSLVLIMMAGLSIYYF